MGIASDLRQSVLQAAMQGKLTTQKAEDGDAKDLLLAIREEKEKLVQERKGKKEKPLAPIGEDEIPFDIPANWIWVRFGDITINLDGKRIPLSERQRKCLKKVYDYYGASGVIDKVDKYLFEKPLMLVGEDGANLLTRSKPIAFIAQGKYWVNNHAHVLDVPTGIDMKYLTYFINVINLAPYVTGTAQPKMNQTRMNTILVSLPPLPEQQRIVARVDALMKEIDKLEQTEKELESIKAAFPGDMKASLLQAAMQGKLTEQKAEDGDARDLLREIRAEKGKLVKEKKGKKEKPLAPITDEEIPFDIPENWVWCRLGDLGKSYGKDSFADGPFGSNLKKEHQITNPEVRIIQLSNIGENGWRDENRRYTSFEHLKTIARCEVQPGDFVIAKMMPAGRTIEVPNLGTEICLGSDAVKFSPHHMLDKKYLLIAMHSDAFLGQVYEEAHGITRVRTSLNKLKGYIIPLPPLAEQHRIVEKLDQLLPLCDSLSEH